MPPNPQPRSLADVVVASPHIGSDMLDCYAALLAQTAKLEHILSKAPSPSTIELVLEAERDFNSCRQRIFACDGHPKTLPHDDTNPLTPTPPHATYAKPCLATERPVLLSLTILAERVVSLLEDMFRQAAQVARTVDQANDFVWSGTSGISVTSTILARRMQRSLRNVMNKPCVSLEMDSYRALQLGDFTIQGQSKSDAMTRILKLRVKRTLTAVETLVADASVKPDRRIGQSLTGPLDWGGSGTAFRQMTSTLLEDLMRRMESLQGAMVLL
ncbi:hypothetical protein GGR57DRAFT_403735 [Xylariaceae sp. FL1272]|nr:hypothetical protein GGR57DRAFT_403735 [Xylariaceae sp. FL1272]